MAQKNFPYQHNSSKFESKPYQHKSTGTSVILGDNFQWFPKEKSSLFQNRKHDIPQSLCRGFYKLKQPKNRKNGINSAYKKTVQSTEKPAKENQFMEIQSKLTDIKDYIKRRQRKFFTLKFIHQDKPKLRETNSTQCQSPKARKFLKQQSKIRNFKKIKMLGKGKFGQVYLVKNINSGFICALKIIHKEDLLCSTPQENQKSVNQLIRQIKIQSFLDHPNLIKLYDFFSDQKNIYLLLEMACDGPLYDRLQKNQSFSQQSTSIIVRQIVAGVDYMHQKNIIHRDIKLQNIVVCHGMAKICDFGWSVYCPIDVRSTLCGTPLYLSPQILQGQLYGKKIDNWAIGTLTHELFTCENPFNIKTKSDLAKIITDDFEMQKGSPELRSFVTFILRKDPSKRPDIDTIKRHPFLQKYRDLQTSEQVCKK